jgi:hypothetical protein
MAIPCGSIVPQNLSHHFLLGINVDTENHFFITVIVFIELILKSFNAYHINYILSRMVNQPIKLKQSADRQTLQINDLPVRATNLIFEEHE